MSRPVDSERFPAVTVALLRATYHALPYAARRDLFTPAGRALTWSARSVRVESAVILRHGRMYQALYRSPAAPALVTIAADAPRCRICGCTRVFQCPGGCLWVLPDRCSCYAPFHKPLQATPLGPGALADLPTFRRQNDHEPY